MKTIKQIDEYISIKEFAEQAGVSVQSIYKRLNRLNNPLNQYIKLVENQKMLNISALEEVYGIEVEQPNHSTYSTSYSTFHSTYSTAEQKENIIKSVFDENKKESQTDNDLGTETDTVSTLIFMLQKELDIKNEQIKELNERLAENQKLLDQQQQLQAMIEQKLNLLEEKEKVGKKWWEFWKKE